MEAPRDRCAVGQLDICQIEWLPADGTGQPLKLTVGAPTAGPDQPLRPTASRQLPLPAQQLILRLLDCDGKDLLKKEALAHGESVFVDYR